MRVLSRAVITITVCALLGVAPNLLSAPADATRQQATSSPEANGLGPLAFLIGEWHLDTWFLQPDGTRRAGEATLTARYTLEGRGIVVEERFPAEAGAAAFVGTRTYVFNARLGKVFGAGINTLGNAKQFAVEFEPGKVIILQSGMQFEGRPGFSRTSYAGIQPDRFEATSEHSEDDGLTWRSEFGYSARRIR